MKRICLAACITFLLASFANAGFITSSGANSFVRNNDSSQSAGNDLQDLSMGFSDEQIGYTFTVNNTITFNQLGVWDGPNSGTSGLTGIGDGLEEAATVTLWQAGTQLRSTVVPLGTAGGADEFAYASIASITLAPGTYTLGATYSSGGNAFYNGGTASNRGGGDPLTTTADVTITSSRFGPAGSEPTVPVGGITGYIGPNAMFATAVPEPSSFLFLGLAFTGALAWKRRVALADVE